MSTSTLGENVYAEGRQAEDAGRNLQGMRQTRQQRFANNAARGQYPYAQQGSEEAAETGANQQGARMRQEVERRMGGPGQAEPQPTFREMEEQGKARPAPPPPPPPPPATSPPPSAAGPTVGPDGPAPRQEKAPLEDDPMGMVEDGPAVGPSNPDAPVKDPTLGNLEIKRHPDGREYLYDPVSGTYSNSSASFKDKPPSEDVLRRVYGMDEKTAKGLQNPNAWQQYQKTVWGDQYDNVLNDKGYGWSNSQQVQNGWIDDEGNYWQGQRPSDSNVWLMDQSDFDRGSYQNFLEQEDMYNGALSNPNATGSGQGRKPSDFIAERFGKDRAKIEAMTKAGKRVAYNPVTGELMDADEYHRKEELRSRPQREAEELRRYSEQQSLLGADENEERKRQAGIPYTDRSGQTHYPWDEDQQERDKLGMTQWGAMPKYTKLDANAIQQFFNRRFGG